MKKERIEQLYDNNSQWITANYDEFKIMDIDNFTQAINQAELEWYKKLLSKLEFIYGSDLKVFGTIIDKNANNYYNEIKNKIKGLEK